MSSSTTAHSGPGGPIIFTLQQLVENSITALYGSASAAAFNNALAEFITADASITVNGKHLTHEQYKNLLLGEKSLEQSASVKYDAGLQVVDDPKNVYSGGNVGLFYTATIVERIDEAGAPLTRTVQSSLNITLVEDGGAQHRKASVLNQVIMSHNNQNRFPTQK